MSNESLTKLRDYLLVTLSYEDRKWLADELDAAGEDAILECPYSKDELKQRFDELENDFDNGDYLPADETFLIIAQELGFENRIERIAV